MDDKIVPSEMPDIGGKKYCDVFANYPVFVDFITKEVCDCTGFFLDFQEYCNNKIKDGR